MALTANDIDLGGMSPHFNDIYYGATTPGSAGTKLDSAALLNAVTIAGVMQTIPPTQTYKATGCNFNATNGTDLCSFAITLPTGYTRYIPTQVIVSNASHTLATAVIGLFTAASGGGTAIEASIALTNVSSTSDATNNNCLVTTVTDSTSRSWTVASYPSVFVNLVTQEGAASTGDVSLVIQLLP